LAAGFCPKKLGFTRKIIVLPDSGALAPSCLGSYTYADTYIQLVLTEYDTYSNSQQPSCIKWPFSETVHDETSAVTVPDNFWITFGIFDHKSDCAVPPTAI